MDNRATQASHHAGERSSVAIEGATRRAFLQGSGAFIAATAIASPAIAQSQAGRATLRADARDDQTETLQRAINEAASRSTPLILPPGSFRTGMLTLPDGAQIIGTRGATRLVFTGGASLMSASGASNITLGNLSFDGANLALADRRGLIHLIGTPGGDAGRALRIVDCEITNSGGAGIWLERMGGSLHGNRLERIKNTGIVSFDAQGLVVSQNTILGTSDNGIEILRHTIGDDGSMVIDNRIENIKAGPGGTGQHGNAINAFRAGNVIIRGNRIRNCDYSAVRGNSASNIQITGNSVSDVREVALYSEFAFEGAVISGNTVDGAAFGISVCNFNEGGRIATISGNIIRNLVPRRPIATAPDDEAGIGIYVEADSAVTGNVIENAPGFGIMSGWGRYMRDITITGNVIRMAASGIGVSAVDGAGTTLISGNLISGASKGAIVGLDHARIITEDLSKPSAKVPTQLLIGQNAIR